MSEKPAAQPKSTEEWQELVRRLQQEHEEKLRGLSASLEKERAEKIEYQNEALKHFEEIQLLRRRIFGRRAEKLSEEDRRQLLLFNEAEEILLAAGHRRAAG